LIELFIVYLVVLAQRIFSFLDPCLTCLVLASVSVRDMLGLCVHILAVSRGLLCSVVLFLDSQFVLFFSFFFFFSFFVMLHFDANKDYYTAVYFLGVLDSGRR